MNSEYRMGEDQEPEAMEQESELESTEDFESVEEAEEQESEKGSEEERISDEIEGRKEDRESEHKIAKRRKHSVIK